MAKLPARVSLTPKPTKVRLTFKAPRKTSLRQGSKLSKIVELLSRPAGASLGELIHVTGWREHSVRAALTTGVKHNLGLHLSSVKDHGSLRRYYAKPPELQSSAKV